MTKTLKKLYFWPPVILWCGLIFYLSSIPNLKTEFGFADLILRKMAHITEYGVLFLLTLRALKNSELSWQEKSMYLSAVIFSVLYAASDEYHQSFVPTRGPSAIDVGIDSIGVFAGYLVAKHIPKKGKII
ncbi:MAG: VanZ family protein [Elusimicrobia bacterium]|nr:VanZ family protein [Candidatus Liberimonas magnetica]